MQIECVNHQKNSTDYSYYQSMLHILAEFCKDKMDFDTAQMRISTLFEEIIQYE